MASKKTALTLALGSAIAASLAGAPVSAADSPFAAQTLGKGYMVAAADEKPADKAAEAKCGNMKGEMKKDKEGKCGDMKKKKKERDCDAPKKKSDKSKEMNCGANMKMDDKKTDAKPAAKAEEGKCAAGKCGASMSAPADKAKK